MDFWKSPTSDSDAVDVMQRGVKIGDAGSVYIAKQLDKGGYPSKEGKEVPLYIRPAAKQMWDKLEETTLLYVQGPPGTGKSSIAWAWACYKSQSAIVLWIGCVRGILYWTFFKEGKLWSGAVAKALYQNIVAGCKAEIIIVDGVVQQTSSTDVDFFLTPVLLWQQKQDSLRKAVFVASHSAVIKPKNQLRLGLTIVTVPSWTYADYQHACANDEFYPRFQKNLQEDGFKLEKCFQREFSVNEKFELEHEGKMLSFTTDKDYHTGETWSTTHYNPERWLEEKFDLGGGSARWVFGTKSDDVRGQIALCLHRAEDLEKLVKGLCGEQSAEQVNSLRSLRIENGVPVYSFISAHVMRTVMTRCNIALIKQLSKYAQQRANPSFDGWIFEFEVLETIRMALNTTETGGAGKVQMTAGGQYFVDSKTLEHADSARKELWDVKSMKSFLNIKDIEKWEPQIFAHGMFLLPQRWNQGGFDVVYLTKRSLQTLRDCLL